MTLRSSWGCTLGDERSQGRRWAEQNGAVRVGNAAELERTLGELLEDAPRRELLGKNALKVVRENQGALQRTVDMIVERLVGGEIYVAASER